MIIVAGLLGILNYNHNANFSVTTNSRDFLYKSWNIITKDSILFTQLQNGDSIVSSTSNDAFEMNAGTFFANTGVRLSYLFNAGIVWPQFSKCYDRTKCSLGGFDARIGEILPNLLRNSMTSKVNTSHNPEWAAQLIRNKLWVSRKKYYLDVIPLSQANVGVVFAEITKFNPTATITTSSLKISTVSESKLFKWKPKIGKYCSTLLGKPMKKSGDYVAYWEIKSAEPNLDIRDLTFGVCN
jgi:hypothetical protein